MTSMLPVACEHAELYPPRNPGALPVCTECATAVLDFDAVYRRTDHGTLEFDHWIEEDESDE